MGNDIKIENPLRISEQFCAQFLLKRIREKKANNLCAKNIKKITLDEKN